MSENTFFQALVVVCATVGFLGSLRFLRSVLELRHQRRPPAATDGLQAHLDRIEMAIEATAVEVERISEANRFMAKLLADRAAIPIAINRPERVITPH